MAVTSSPETHKTSCRWAGLVRICQVIVLATLLASCSRIQLAYNNLDWLLPHYLASYMPLSDDQDSQLETRVNHFLHWHCSTQVAGYADLLRAANDRFQSGDLTRAELQSFNDRVELAWADILRQASPAIADILVTADDAQVRELFEGFAKRNAEWLEDFEEINAEELRDDYQSRMEKELQRWFGRLNKSQLELLSAWSAQFQPLGLEGLEMRRRWQSRLRALMNNRRHRDAFRREFAELINNPAALRSLVYQQRIDHNREVTIDMLHHIVLQLSDAQKRHLQRQVDSIAGDFDSLACSGETVASS